MARRRSSSDSKAMSVRVEGGLELAKLPGWLDTGQRALMERAGTRVRDEIRKRAPGGPLGSAGRAVKMKVRTSTTVEIGSSTRDFPGARALEKGAYITPKGLRGLTRRELLRQPRRLRITTGGRTTYPVAVRIPAKRYHEKGARTRTKIVKEEYGKAFGDLERTAAASRGFSGVPSL